ncbi:CLT3 [Symbiodinium sp. KB8]|nr:CLT3 [Symbiodinium sp. KB8]
MWDYAMSNPVLLGAFGLCEGAFFPLVFYSAARLPGSLVQVLNQSLIPFTVLFSFIFLSRRYDRIQLLGVLVVLWGVTLFTSLPRSTGSSSVFVILCIAAYGLQAAAMVVKETVFVQFSQKQMRGGSESSPFDASLFLTIGTCCRCAIQLLAWPLFLQLVSPGLGIRSSATAGAMAMMHPAVLPLTIFYIMANVGISITALLLVQKSSASTVVLANVVALPLSALIFCLPLPSLERQVFQWRFAVSLLLIVLGIRFENHSVPNSMVAFLDLHLNSVQELAKEKMLDNLVTPESGFYAALAPDMSLHLLHFAPPHIIRALSECPPIERIEESVLQMNAACNFRDARGDDASEGLYTSSTAFLRLHLFQSQLGVEMLSQHLQKQVCRRPLCRGYAEVLRQRVRGCPEDAGHKGVIARVARAVDTTMASCLEVHSASHGDATHSEVSSGGGALAGVWSSDMSEKNHVLISGLDTGSAAEMRAVEAAVGRILADELQLPLFAFEERGQSFADVFDPLLGGPNVFTVTESRLRVAAQLTPLPSGEPFDESVGRFNEPKQEIPVQQNAYFAEQHNLQMLAIQPRWNEQGIDPSRLRIRIIFEEVVTKDDPSAVIRVFPVALRDICSSLQPDDELQWQMFPADTGLGSLEPASGGSGADPLDSVPVGFVCHVIAAGDDVQVLASGEVLQIELSQPLLRNTKYVVLLPPRIVKAAMGSTTFPGALWEGWPSEEGQDNQEYVFTTGTPKVSNARLSIAVSCSSEEECERQRRLVSEQGMEDLASRASCFAAWFRCNQDPVAQKHCEIPDQSTQWCDPHGSWAPSWSPPRKKQDVQLSSVPDQAVSEVQSIYLPSWVYIVSLAAWVQGTFATLRAAWWVSDLYTQSRDFDPYVAQGSRSLPLKACAVSMAIPLLVGILGAFFAVPVFRIAVRGLWSQGGSNQQGALVDAERLHHQLAAAFTVCFCASEAFTAVFAYSLIARFKSWVADKGQLISISSLCCAAAGAAGAACGWVASSGVRHMTHPSLGLALGIVVLLAGVLFAHILSLTIMPGAIFGLLWEMPGIGDILSHAVKYQIFHWRKWFEHGRESGGSWSDFVLLIADIEVDEGFVQSMLNMGMDDGHLFIKFYCSETPQDVSATRSQAVQWEGADDGLVQKFDGEDIFVNFTNPLALLRVDVMFQEETANRPECVATTIWDPWCAKLLNKYFSNFALCDARSDHTDFWNPKDVFHPDGRPIDGVFLELELNLTRHRTDCGPEMGLLRFHATHMGGFGSKRQSRLHPWEKPEKLLALGDTIPGRNNIYWRRPVVDVRKTDFQDGRFHRAAEEEEEEQRRMAHRQELRHQLEHQQHQQTPRPRSPRSPSWRHKVWGYVFLMTEDVRRSGRGARQLSSAF